MKGIFFLLITTISQFAFGQGKESLRSFRHGWDLVFGDEISIDTLINDLKFLSEMKNFDVIRIDNQGNSLVDRGPLVISTEEPIWSDSLGLVGLQLEHNSMKSFLKFLADFEANSQHKGSRKFRFRISYSNDGKRYQCYLEEPQAAVVFFKTIEKMLLTIPDKDLLRAFYFWLYPSELIRNYSGEVVWRY